MKACDVFCPKCRARLPVNRIGLPMSPCTYCDASILVVPFPALVGGLPWGQRGKELLADDEASCYYHPRKEAAVACDECGRFLCLVCDVQVGPRHLCPNCIALGHGVQKRSEMDSRRTLFDSAALLLSLVPLLGPPIALFLLARWWSAPGALVPRGRWRNHVAAVISVIQIAFWAWVFLME